jgi:pantetheine-phosphate adenylyltransferase
MDIARRAAELFDKLIVAVYDRPQKNLMFSTRQRVEMLAEAFADTPQIQVASYTGMPADYAHEQGAHVIVRGLRVVSDFEREYQMALTTRRLAPDVDMVCLMTSLEYAFLSSTIVKEIALAGGSVVQFVPPHVERALQLASADR